MGLNFCAIASGSSGNCYMIQSDTTTLLADVGISGKRIAEGLKACGTSMEDVSAILVTHEHSDHVKSLGIMQRKIPEATVWSNLGTYQKIAREVEDGRHRTFTTGEEFCVGDIAVTPFSVSHDAAEPVGFSFRKDDSKMAIVTDTGYVTEEIYEAMRGSDLLVLEANHDENVLMVGRYPYHVKRRILSDHGHLCNEAAAHLMARLLKEEEKRPVFLLAHLSKENNTPDMALLTVRNILEEDGAFANRPDGIDDLYLAVLERNHPSPLFQL